MNAYGIYRSLMGILVVGLIAVAGFIACIVAAYQEISLEMTLHRDYGDGWRVAYERYHGSVSDGHVKIVLGILGALIIPALVYYLSRAMRPEWQRISGNNRPRRRHHGSSKDRFARFRRNALIGICLGVFGIFAGAGLVVFRWGIFEEHDNEASLGMVCYLGGYVGIIAGCSFWLKAKAWIQEIALIGLLPLLILFIPFVRLIFLVSPLLLPLSMGMMSIILITVVYVLPDKSGHDGRGSSSSRSRMHRDHYH